MLSLLVLLGSIGLTPTSYSEAYSLYKQEERPILVVFSTETCEHCGPLKKKLRNLKLNSVSYVELDAEKDEGLARLFLKGYPNFTVPSMFYFKRVNGKDSMREKTGNLPEIELKGFLQ